MLEIDTQIDLFLSTDKEPIVTFKKSISAKMT